MVLLFVGMAVAFLLVRLPEEVDRADDAVDADFLRRACRRTPLEEVCEELLADPGADPKFRSASGHHGLGSGLRALHDLGILDEVRVISTVSGGSVIGALYAARSC